jgi:hypothetical protein
MALSRISLVPILAATGLVLLIGCKKEEAPPTETTATTSTTATSTTAPTETATTGTTATTITTTATTGTTGTTGTPKPLGPPYGPQKTKTGRWGTTFDEHVQVTFGPGNVVITVPEPGEFCAKHPHGGGPGTITWTADPGVTLYVDVVTPQPGPACVDGLKRVSKNVWTAKANPGVGSLQPPYVADLCKVKIWKEGMTKPEDPEVVVDNCCP